MWGGKRGEGVDKLGERVLGYLKCFGAPEAPRANVLLRPLVLMCS